MKRKRVVRYLRDHRKKSQKGIYLNDTKEYNFPHGSIYTWNGLKEEVIMTKNVQ